MPSVPPPSTVRPGLPCPPAEIDDFLSQPTPRVLEVVARTRGPFLVLGAGGKIGLHLSAMLRLALDALGRKDRVIAISRFSTLRDRAAFEQRGVETLACDLSVEAEVNALPDAPTVFFLAGVKFGTSTAPGLLHAINVEIPHRVAAKYARSRIVAYSSGCVYPFVTPASGGAREDTPPAPVGEYAASCVAREQAFTGVAAARGTPVALIRLNYSIEFRYGLLVDIAQKVLAGQPVDVTTGYVNVIWQTDAVAHSIQALEVAGAPAVPINVTGADTLSVRDVAHRFASVLGRTVQITGTEAETAWLNNAAHSHRLFGPPLTTVDQMVRWISEWLRDGGETWGKPTGFERRDGRF
ncbi:NAD-dependent epimerase/dehydratase family protein [Horticoccus sp. 23ND18S-11]|uniref:NAD-dependent epimerase/dehydratase family protein n=1 Tax=Horticoccus sp. 23ND18S-11 TaxID=3391832 RepID=UPI0039C958D9